MKRQEVTAGQIVELTEWARRLTPNEYQASHRLLRRATDPQCDLGPKLLWPFKDERPLAWSWKGVEREGALCEAPVPISRLELVPFHKEGENVVSGEEMLRRASDEKTFPGCQGWSQHHAEDILEQAAKLRKEWAREDGPILVFPDTILLDEDGRRSVPCLFCEYGAWQFRWLRLDGDFDRRF